MKKTAAYLLMTALVMAGCGKYLDVNPKGEVFDNDMFTSGEGYEDALYGVYNELATADALYGAHLQWIAETCSQNVTCIGDYKFGNLSLGDWYSTGPADIRKKTWSAAYETINHLNNIIQHTETGGEDEFPRSGLYKGEALALRALIHFDLLRLYSVPVWAGAEEKAEAIPYVENYSFDITPFSSQDEVFEKILRDLLEAERLLAEDEELVPAVRDNAASGFTAARITHLNRYAVEALLSRVYWTRGDMANAALYALRVIESGKFSFRPQSAFVQPDNGTLDLNETIFGFFTQSQKTNAGKYRLTGTGSSSTTFTLAPDWHSLYEGNASRSDYRLTAWFNDGDQTLTKLVNRIFYAEGGSSYAGPSILGTNILRIPEMYYILAEYYIDSNPTLAAEYYDAVVTARGLDPISGTGVNLTEEMLFQERRREFYGEGFTWHEMKRRGMDITTATGEVLSGALSSTYTLPVPDEEWEARNNIN